MGLCLWKKKGRGRQSIKGLSAWLAARSAFLRLPALRLDLLQALIHIAKCSLA